MGDPTRPKGRSGETLAGKYQLLELLGEGGMGQVYRAENTLLGRPVAIKILLSEFRGNREVMARFVQEGRAANVVRHPNVVDVLDVGTDDAGTPFIVQELLDGENLADYMQTRGGRLSFDEVEAYVLPIIDVVGLMHSRGVVHRDLKPENIFLARVAGRTVPKLLDFGLARVEPRDAGPRITKSRASFGTPAYMSPEQVLGKGIGPSSDVWALGVVLYEAMTGRFPFDASTSNEFLVHIATRDPLPLVPVGEWPHGIEALVLRCLRRDAGERFADATELRDALLTCTSMATESWAPEPSGNSVAEAKAKLLPPPAPVHSPQRPAPLPELPDLELELPIPHMVSRRGPPQEAHADSRPSAVTVEPPRSDPAMWVRPDPHELASGFHANAQTHGPRRRVAAVSPTSLPPPSWSVAPLLYVVSSFALGILAKTARDQLIPAKNFLAGLNRLLPESSALAWGIFVGITLASLWTVYAGYKAWKNESYGHAVFLGVTSSGMFLLASEVGRLAGGQ